MVERGFVRGRGGKGGRDNTRAGRVTRRGGGGAIGIVIEGGENVGVVA